MKGAKNLTWEKIFSVDCNKGYLKFVRRIWKHSESANVSKNGIKNRVEAEFKVNLIYLLTV